MTDRDSGCVFHIDILDTDIRAGWDQSRPWVLETDEDNHSFATEDDACKAQREYRAANGFDEMTGEEVYGDDHPARMSADVRAAL